MLFPLVGETGYVFLNQFLFELKEIGRAGTSRISPRPSELVQIPEPRFADAGSGFVGVFRSCVMATLENILGKPAMGALVLHFKIDQLASSPSGIHQALAGVFGNGATVLEKIILKELYRNLDLVLEDHGLAFDQMVLNARDAIRNPRRGREK